MRQCVSWEYGLLCKFSFILLKQALDEDYRRAIRIYKIKKCP